MARPKKKFTDDEKKLIVALYGEGKIDEEIAKILKTPRKTFTDRLKYNNLTATIKKAKKTPNGQVEAAMFKKALGFWYEEVKVTKYRDGTTRQTITRKYVPPSDQADMNWLCNRDPEKWKHVMSLQIGGDAEGNPIVFNVIDATKGSPLKE